MLRDARGAQSRFESLRRMRLPRDRRGGSGGRCDARIGRFCYWYDSTESSAAPEAAEIVRARSELIVALDRANTLNPGDGWIAGQRTRYLLEAGRPLDALVAARDCSSDRWWCLALEGLALHVNQQYERADSAFAASLREMPAGQRCDWLDLRKIVAPRTARALARASCEERPRISTMLWTLAQPFWSGTGNDLRTEHFARLTTALILARSASPYGMAFGADSRELLVRYGAPESYTREDRTPSMYTEPAIYGHDREPSYFFFPDIPVAQGNRVTTPTVTARSWSLREAGAPSRYSPRYLKSLSELGHQLAIFPRGDSMLVAARFDVRDTALSRDSITAFIGTLQDAGLRVGAMRGSRRAIWTVIPADTTVVSLEVLGVETSRAARARYTIVPRRSDGASLSDLLLFDGSLADSVGDLLSVLEHAWAGGVVSARAPLGVYWEVEGLSSGRPVWVGLTVEPARVGLARKLATRLRLAPPAAPIRLRWQSVLRKQRESQTVAVRLPPNARGEFRITLTVERPDAPALVSSREIEIVP